MENSNPLKKPQWHGSITMTINEVQDKKDNDISLFLQLMQYLPLQVPGNCYLAAVQVDTRYMYYQ